MHNVPRNLTLDEQKKQAREQTRLKYKSLKESLLQDYHSQDLSESKLKDTATLLHISPDFYTLWNYRKAIIRKELEEQDDATRKEILQRELQLTESLLRRDIKSYPTWHHRKWIMELLNDESAWRKEIQDIVLVLKYDLRNFHCWNYRRDLLQVLHYDAREELKFLENLFEDNPSNYSAWHNRSLMLHAIKEAGHDITPLVSEEFDWCKQGFYTDPADSAAWIYHRWMLHSEEGKNLNLIAQDDELCEELSEMAKEEDDPKELAQQLKWPHLTHVLNAVEFQQGEEFSKERYEHIISEFDELISVDPKRRHFYEDKRSDFILQHAEVDSQNRLILQNSCLTRIDALHSLSAPLTEVDISNNKIRQLSIFMQDLPHMHTLRLNNNSIRYIEGVEQFSSLKTLELRDNSIEYIGNEKVLSSTVEVLDLRGNQLRESHTSMEYLRRSFPNLRSVLV